MRFFRWLIGYIDLTRELEEKDRVIADLQEQNAALLRQEGMDQRDHIEINRLYRELNDIKYGHAPKPKPAKQTSPPHQHRHIGGHLRNSSAPSRSSSHSSTHSDIATSIAMRPMFSDTRNSDSCSPSSDSSNSSSSSDSGSSSCDSGSF